MPAAPAIAAAVPAIAPAATAAAAQPALGFPVSDWVTFPVIALVLLGLILTLVTVGRALGAPNSGWSLAEALSEEADVTQTAADGSPVMAGGAPVKITRLAASSSRLIAFIGMLAILFLYLGFGVFILWGFSQTGTIPASTGEVTSFLIGGLTLFAPYIANKFASLFAPR